MESTRERRGMGLFPILWASGLIAIIGARVSGFGIGVELFRETGSVTRFSLYGLAMAIPAILVTPAAGAVADRFDRRLVLLLSSFGSLLGSLVLFLLVKESGTTSWWLYPVLMFRAACGAFTLPAFFPVLTLMVDKEHYARASGMMSAGEAISQIIGPLLGGLLLVRFDVATLILVALFTSLVMIFTLLAVRFPEAPPKGEGDEAADDEAPTFGPPPMETDNAIQVGWHFVRDRPGLFGLLLIGGMAGFSMGTLQMVFTPLVLSFAGPVALGIVLSIASFGMLAGGLVMSVWGGPAPARRIVALLGGLLIQGLLLLLAGFEPNAMLIASAAFFYMLTVPFLSGISQALWQSKTPLDIQGRVFAFRGLVAGLAVPLAIGAAGPLADFVFEPLLAEGGALAPTLG